MHIHSDDPGAKPSGFSWTSNRSETDDDKRFSQAFWLGGMPGAVVGWFILPFAGGTGQLGILVGGVVGMALAGLIQEVFK